MLLEPFAYGNSYIHRLDPRMRLGSAGLYSIVVALSYRFPTLTMSVLASLVWVMLARLPLRNIFKRIIVLNTFNVFLWIVLPLTFQGPVTVALGPLALYKSGIAMAAQITLKSNAIFLMIIALVATMDLSTLGHALSWLRVPDKIVHLLSMCFRYVFLIEQEYQRLVRAARFRGFNPRTNLHTYRTYASIVGMLFVRSAMRANRVQQAMLCRGFKRKFYCLHDFKAGRDDGLFALVMAAVIIVLVCCEWLGINAAK